MNLIIGGDMQQRMLYGLVVRDSTIWFCCYLFHDWRHYLLAGLNWCVTSKPSTFSERNILSSERKLRIFFSVVQRPKSGLGRLVLRFLNKTQTRKRTHTAARTPLNEWSRCRRGRYLQQYTTNIEEEILWIQGESNLRSQRSNGFRHHLRPNGRRDRHITYI